MGAVGRHFHFGYGWWRECGWLQFKGWLRELRASQEREQRSRVTDPDSWDGVQHDAWWQQARQKGRQ